MCSWLRSLGNRPRRLHTGRPDRLVQALANLLSNALAFATAEIGTLRSGAETARAAGRRFLLLAQPNRFRYVETGLAAALLFVGTKMTSVGSAS